MLRITVHEKPRSLTFRLEGRLAGPWLQELDKCWRSTLARQRKPTLCVDLTGVTFIDAAGQASLAALHRQGAEFLAADCLTKGVVDEITQRSEVRDQRTEGEVFNRDHPTSDL
jgi:anti-anti-sigma regulatory factor